MKKQTLRIIPLGGAGEMGRNMTVYEYENQLLVVDAGLMFPENDMLGVDYIIPDLDFLIKRKDKISGIVITHGHEDHIGAIRHVLEAIQAPIYATPLTRGLLEVKLARNGLLQKTELHTVEAGKIVEIGPFQVEFFHVCHSIPDGVGLGIQTPAGLIVHTGDYKFDQTPVDNWPTDYAKLAEFSRRGTLAIVGDSTNAVEAGWTPSEQVIASAFEQVFSEAKGRVIIASFASLISRMQQVANTAIKYQRKLSFIGTSMVDNAKMARALGYLDIPDSLLVTNDQALKMPKDQVVLMCTGTQGEPNSILGRLSTDRHRQLSVEPGDTIVLSSKAIPGNEEMVYRTINRLIQRGANVIYEALAPVHVSGHASQEEIKLMLTLVKPKYVVPLHGEIRQQKMHARIAQQVGTPPENIALVDNGQVIEFQNGEMNLGEKFPIEYVFVDGSSVGDVSTDIVRERELLAKDGILIINLVIDSATHELAKEPQIISRGFMLSEEADEVLSQASQRIIDAVSRSNGNLEKAVVKSVRTYLYSEIRRSPMIFVTANEI